MKNVYQTVKDYGEKLNDLKSPLASDWETVLFKAIDILHNIEMEGFAKTSDIKAVILPIIIEERYNDLSINKAIQATQELRLEDPTVKDALKEVLNLLFSVKISLNSRR